MSRGTPRDAPGESVLATLAGVARREAGSELPPEASARGHDRALAAFRLHARRSSTGRGGRPTRAAWLVAAVVACLLALAVIRFPRALRFTVDGAPQAAGSYVPAGAALRFSDGSVITFAADAGGRIAECGPHGARVLLESGTASFQIVHLPGASWSVEAGPFAIAVIGTAFEASWSPDAQAVEVRLHEGEVSVRGPPAPTGVHLRAGQRLRARAAGHDGPLGPAGGELWIGEAETPPAVLEETTAAPDRVTGALPPRAEPGEHAARSPLVASAAPTARRAAPSWPRRVAAGDFAGVVLDAEARGVDPTVRAVPLGDLVALADAARYAGRPALARRALLEQRARFAGSPEARAAAFLLGRLADDSGEPTDAAIHWYEAYLTEAPGGAFAPEALGRKLTALRRTGDPAARAAAAEYLRRYPEGPYAAAARELSVDP